MSKGTKQGRQKACLRPRGSSVDYGRPEKAEWEVRLNRFVWDKSQRARSAMIECGQWRAIACS